MSGGVNPSAHFHTKTDTSRRTVSLSPSTTVVPREYRRLQEENQRSLGSTLTDEDLVLCQIDDKPLLPDSITHAWMKLARHAGLKGVTLHDAQHTHASIMLKQGLHPNMVRERLGHANMQIHLIPMVMYLLV